MAEITAAMVKALREDTQLPMMECKKALQECNGDPEAAKQHLREQGAKFMSSRQDRATEDGRIAIYASLDPGVGAIVELQCESAPVGASPEFVQLAEDLARQLAQGPGASEPEELWSQPSPSRKGATLRDQKDDLENKIREVFRLVRIARLDGPCGSYVHHDGKSGALLEVESGDAEIAREICMHITAMRPKATRTEELDAALVENERKLLREAARKEGKPDNILEKMVEGRLRNFFAEHVLEEQPFVKDDSQTVGKVAAGKGMKLKQFLRWQLGEQSAASGA